MLYLFDNAENLIKVIGRADIEEAIYEEKINTAKILYVTTRCPVSDLARFCMIRQAGWGTFYRILTVKSVGTGHEIKAIEKAYEDLEYYSYIRDKRFYPGTIQNCLSTVLEGTHWPFAGTDFTGNIHVNFYYESRLECLKKIVERTGGEAVFVHDFDGKRVTNRRTYFYQKQSNDYGKRFVHGDGLLKIERESSCIDLYTALIGMGASLPTVDENGNETGGYTRRITFKDVEWKVSEGFPVDKPLGQDYVEIPEATSQFGLDNGATRRVGKVIFEDVTSQHDLLWQTYRRLEKLCRPQVSYSATVRDIGQTELGETVTIIRRDFNIAYKTRVYKRTIDLLNPTNTKLEIGDEK
jgi:phage minor structural protein